MTGRERIQAAFSQDGTPEIPAVICYESIYVRDHWDELIGHPWWYLEAPDIERQMDWIRDLVLQLDEDWLPLGPCRSTEERERLSIDVRADGVFLVDVDGGQERRLEEPVVGGQKIDSLAPPARVPETYDEIDVLLPPPEEVDRERLIAEGRADLTTRMREAFPALFPVGSAGGPLWHCMSLWGFEGTMTRVAEHPDLVEYACGRMTERSIRDAQEYAALGAEGIWVEDCMTSLISPDAFRRLNVPFLRQLVASIRQAGMRSIYYYCGNPAGKLDDILAIGADAIAFEESKKGFKIDIADVVEFVDGRSTVLGNLDAIRLLEHGTDDQLRAGIAYQVAAGRRNDGRFIMSLGSPVTPGTPAAHVRRYIDLVRELGST